MAGSISALIDASFGARSFPLNPTLPAWAAGEAPRVDAPAAPAAPSVKPAEPRVSKQTFAAQVGMSVRWVEQRISDGMPCEYIDGRPRIVPSAGEAWLRANGHLTTTPKAGPNRG